MDTLKKQQVNYRYNCFKRRLAELKALSANDENCDTSRFVICMLEASQMVDYMFREFNVMHAALEKACATAFCQSKDNCDDECNENCVKGAITKLLYGHQLDIFDEDEL